MKLNDILNKGIDLLNKGANTVKEAAQEKYAAHQEFNLLITRSNHLSDMKPYEVKNQNPSIGREQLILGKCLTINVENSKVINRLIPIEETIVNVKTSKESKTELVYFFIVTDNCLWVSSEKEYKIYNFTTIANCEIVDKSIMTQYVKFDNNAFAFDGSEGDIQNFCRLLTDAEYRTQETGLATNYLCGIKPKEQYLNIHLSGMSLGENGEIVFHNGAKGNKLTKKENISYVQLLMDNTVVMTKGKPDMQSMVSAMYDCRKMSIKVVLTDGEYVFDILPQNMMGTLIKKEDSVYINNYEFAKTIINRIEELLRKW